MKTLKYISVDDITPDYDENEPHTKRLLLLTEKYGEFLGFYDGEHFRTNYAEILENVTHYAFLPNHP